MPAPRPSDICLSVRGFGPNNGTLEDALALMDALRPTRLEWSYITDRDPITRFRAITPVFVAALNTISPPGRARSFTGEPVIAPWMTRFGTPDARATYICQNNPRDLQSRVRQAVALIADEVTDCFQFDDWYGNAQMIDFGNCCFCRHCRREFAAELGIDFDYQRYLRGRGFTHYAQIREAAERGEVPLWDDYQRFQQRTVTRFFRTLRTQLEQALGRPVTLSVNGSVLHFGGDIRRVLPLVDYLHSETPDFQPGTLLKLAEASRELETTQIVSFFPTVAASDYHDPDFVGTVNQAIGLSYCLGLLPLFPYDVYAGNEPDGALKARWFGAWEEYRGPYETVRAHPEWFDDYAFAACTLGDDGDVTVLSHHRQDPARRLRHTLSPDGSWRTDPQPPAS